MNAHLCPPALDGPRLRALLRPVLLSPTSFNLQHWRFIVLDPDDAPTRRLIDPAATSAAAAAHGPATWIVVASWVGAWAHAGHYALHLPDDVRAIAERNSHAVYGGRERVQRDEAFRSSGLALASLARVCAEDGLDCQVLPVADPVGTASRLDVLDGFVVTAAAVLRPLGTQARQATARRRPVVHVDHYLEESS